MHSEKIHKLSRTRDWQHCDLAFRRNGYHLQDFMFAPTLFSQKTSELQSSFRQKLPVVTHVATTLKDLERLPQSRLHEVHRMCQRTFLTYSRWSSQPFAEANCPRAPTLCSVKYIGNHEGPPRMCRSVPMEKSRPNSAQRGIWPRIQTLAVFLSVAEYKSGGFTGLAMACALVLADL
jgi:hypothetical protein